MAWRSLGNVFYGQIIISTHYSVKQYDILTSLKISNKNVIYSTCMMVSFIIFLTRLKALLWKQYLKQFCTFEFLTTEIFFIEIDVVAHVANLTICGQHSSHLKWDLTFSASPFSAPPSLSSFPWLSPLHRRPNPKGPLTWPFHIQPFPLWSALNITMVGRKVDKSHSQMLGKFEYGGGPIFKVVIEC